MLLLLLSSLLARCRRRRRRRRRRLAAIKALLSSVPQKRVGFSRDNIRVAAYDLILDRTLTFCLLFDGVFESAVQKELRRHIGVR